MVVAVSTAEASTAAVSGSWHWSWTRSRPCGRLRSLRLPLWLRLWLLRFPVRLQRLLRWRLLSRAPAGLDSLWLAVASSPGARLTTGVRIRPASAGGAAMDVGGWLRGLGLEHYEAAFRENKIDDTVLPSLDG